MYAISVYAPTEDTSEKEKDQFYADLEEALKCRPKDEIPHIFGDFNAIIKSAPDLLPIVGENAIGTRTTDNGYRLIEFCRAHKFVLSNTLVANTGLCGKSENLWTWMHPNGDIRNQIDYILLQRHVTNENTRVLSRLPYESDHRIVCTTLSYRPIRESSHVKRKIAIDALRYNSPQQNEYKSLMDTALKNHAPCENVKAEWNNLKAAMLLSAQRACRNPKAKTKYHWVDEKLLDAISDKQEALMFCRKQDLNPEEKEEAIKKYETKRKIVSRAFRSARSSYYASKADVIQSAARNGNYYKLFQAAKELTERTKIPTKDNPAILSKNGPISYPKGKANAFGDYFCESFNPKRPLFNLEAIQEDIQMIKYPPISDEIRHLEIVQNDLPPTEEEVAIAISVLKNRKAPGEDGITPELFKYGGKATTDWMTRVLRLCWQGGIIPEEWAHARVIPIYKGAKKGSASNPQSYRPISIMNTGSKIMSLVLTSRITPRIDRRLHESQNGFRRNRGTDDAVFTLRRITEKVRNTNTPLYLVYLDLQKAYDTIPRKAVWAVLQNMGVEGPLLHAIRATYHETKASVIVGSETSSTTFEVEDGIKQGCPMSCPLLNATLDAILRRSMQIKNTGINIQWRIPNGRSNRGEIVAGTDVVGILAYADDVVLWSDDKSDLQTATSTLSEIMDRWGIKINTNKSKTQVIQPIESNSYYTSDITIRKEKLEQVRNFIYLGSVIDEDTTLDKDIKNRIKGAYSNLKQFLHLWKNRSISKKTKRTIFEACVVSRLLFGCISWALTVQLLKKLNKTYIRLVKVAMGIPGVINTPQRCRNHKQEITASQKTRYISQKESLRLSGMGPLQAKIDIRLLHFVGHIARMGSERVPNKILFGKYKAKTLARYISRKTTHTYQRNIESALSRADMGPIIHWKTKAQNKKCWYKAIKLYESETNLKRRRKTPFAIRKK